MILEKKWHRTKDLPALCCLCKDCDLGIFYKFNDKKVDILKRPFNFKHHYKLHIQEILLNLLCEKEKSLQILLTITTKSTIIWDVALCKLTEAFRVFGGTYSLHLQGQRADQARKQQHSDYFTHRRMLKDQYAAMAE
jgi:hypothetical protein